MMTTPLFYSVDTMQAQVVFIIPALMTMFSILFLVFITNSRISWSSKAQSHSHDLQANQELAVIAENSQISELQRLLRT